ncbi:hypothetical protein [Microbulbifer rhizosphaerae]|uniref:Uncharacterized protein n=1 Tax=Microbulbifer rhizosphaerae TaxID=1562603 RepID=A0A7W4WB61_9GAMM|nr:hypothetical protein [Microbulbifer rhizosphaerae]MBB3060834.1 hypothetical protein [Microbulbifer rhizosphaerae]
MSTYLVRAEWAIDHVKNTVRIKAGNRAEGINRRQDERVGTNDWITRGRKFARQQFAQRNLQPGLGEADIRAQVAAFSKCGNCTEQSALAFEYLRGRGERGLAWMGLPDQDHMFVVMGLHTQPRDNAFFSIGGGTPQGWGPNAVVCDPWYHEWFLVRDDWNRKIRHILNESGGALLPDGTWCKIQCRAYV